MLNHGGGKHAGCALLHRESGHPSRHAVVTKVPSGRRFLLLVCLLGLVAFYAGAHFVTTRPTLPRHPFTGRQIAGLATDAQWLDRPAREEEEEPERALELIGITPGFVVADVGAGTGYMTVRLARRVGPTGKVYANELQPVMLQLIQDK